MATARALRLFASTSKPSSAVNKLRAAVHHRRLLSATASTEASGAGDPALHSGDAPSEEYTEGPPRFSGAQEATTTTGGGGHRKQTTPPEPATSNKEERAPPFGPSAKLGSQEVADPPRGASLTQKRRLSSSRQNAARDEATPGREESAARKVRAEDREYYRTHKPSPLAEIEFTDTRKPVTRATDGGAADADDVVTTGAAVVEDTVDDSLARAEAMFREAAARGNPEWPHSRALAEMLARRRDQGNDDAPWSS